MPITIPAHQLAIAPLVRLRGGRWPGSALVVGSMLPDLAFPLGGYPASALAHELYGPLLLIPVGIALYIWSERVLAPALRIAVPERWARLAVTRGLPATARGWLWAVAAIVVGAYTHVIVDGFTHEWMWPADALYAGVWVGPLRLAQLFQLVASLAGSIAAVAWASRRTRQCPALPDTPHWRRRLGIAAIVALACGVAGIGVGLVLWGWPVHYRDYTTLACPMLDAAFVGVSVAAWRRA